MPSINKKLTLEELHSLYIIKLLTIHRVACVYYERIKDCSKLSQEMHNIISIVHNSPHFSIGSCCEQLMELLKIDVTVIDEIFSCIPYDILTSIYQDMPASMQNSVNELAPPQVATLDDTIITRIVEKIHSIFPNSEISEMLNNNQDIAEIFFHLLFSSSIKAQSALQTALFPIYEIYIESTIIPSHELETLLQTLFKILQALENNSQTNAQDNNYIDDSLLHIDDSLLHIDDSSLHIDDSSLHIDDSNEATTQSNSNLDNEHLHQQDTNVSQNITGDSTDKITQDDTYCV